MRKNILLIIPSLGIGGAENAISKISLELAKTNSVFVCIFNRDIAIGFSYGGKLISLDIPGGNNLLEKGLNFWRRITKLRKLKKELNIQAAVSFLEGADYINILSRSNEKVIISIRSSKTHNESIIGHFDFVRNKVLIPQLYRQADTIVAVQENIVQELTTQFNLPKEKIVVINNFFDKQYILPKAAELIGPEVEQAFNTPVIIAAGRLTPIKGFSYLIDAFVLYNKLNPESKLVILGDGPLRNELEQQAHNSGLKVFANWGAGSLTNIAEASIVFLGHQSNPYKYYSRAALFVVSSLSEGFPNALAEAMICGVPVASSDCPYGPREILAPGTEANFTLKSVEFAKYGTLLPMFRPGDANAIKVWADAFQELIGNPERQEYYKQQGQRRMEMFSKDQILAQWQQVLDS